MEGALLSMLRHVPASSRQEQREEEGHSEEPRKEGPGSWAGQ